MAEYIDRQKLIQDIDDSVRFTTRNGVSAELRGAHKIVDRIRSAPACDVVEVVRCKNCTHSFEYQENLFCCFYPLTNFSVSPNGYCYNGERRSDNE